MRMLSDSSIVCLTFYVFWLCLLSSFFFSSRRRHTRCALVTGVQTCALPICAFVALLIVGFVSTFHYAVRATRQAQETARQRDRAQAVSDFLVRIFSAANPREHLGEMPNAGELLDRGVRDIERDHTLDPEKIGRAHV